MDEDVRAIGFECSGFRDPAQAGCCFSVHWVYSPGLPPRLYRHAFTANAQDTSRVLSRPFTRRPGPGQRDRLLARTDALWAACRDRAASDHWQRDRDVFTVAATARAARFARTCANVGSSDGHWRWIGKVCRLRRGKTEYAR